MAKATPNIDFDEIAKIINSNFEEHKTKVKECCFKTSVIPLSDYFDALQKEYKQIENSITPPKGKPDPLDYIDLFKAFDEYPSNLQKPKKRPVKEYSRMNVKIPTSKQNSSSTSINSSKLVDELPSAAAIYNEFSRYIEKLADFRVEFQQQSRSQEYAEKLESINTFAKELDKLLQSKDVGVDTFTKEEEAKIKKICEYMEHFVYIKDNQNLYSEANEIEGNSARLNDLVDIVTDALLAVYSYKPQNT